jgi:hypothetical protein
MLTIVYSGWTTISYDTQKEITRDFVSDQTRDEYLQFLMTPGAVRPEIIGSLSPTERIQLIFDLV